MKGYVRQRWGRFYAVVYEGRDPVTGKERRIWHPAGTDRAEAEALATRLAAEETGRIGAVRSLTFGAYLTGQWLPAKKLHVATSTYRGYQRNVHRHIGPRRSAVKPQITPLPQDSWQSLQPTPPDCEPWTWSWTVTWALTSGSTTSPRGAEGGDGEAEQFDRRDFPMP